MAELESACRCGARALRSYNEASASALELEAAAEGRPSAYRTAETVAEVSSRSTCVPLDARPPASAWDPKRMREVVFRIAGDVLEHPDVKAVRAFDTASVIADRVVIELPALEKHAEGCEVGPYHAGRCAVCDTDRAPPALSEEDRLALQFVGQVLGRFIQRIPAGSMADATRGLAKRAGYLIERLLYGSSVTHCPLIRWNTNTGLIPNQAENMSRPFTPPNPPPCRWPSCRKLSEFFALDNRAKFGHLCLAHWRGYISYDEQQCYAGAPQGAFGIRDP